MDGFLVNPKAKDIYQKISFLIENPKVLEEISENSKKTIEKGFSKKIWEKKWIEYINEVF